MSDDYESPVIHPEHWDDAIVGICVLLALMFEVVMIAAMVSA